VARPDITSTATTADRQTQPQLSYPVRERRVRRIRVHGTRHTCGSILAALDVHPRVAIQILRHSKISITMEIDTQVPEASTREALRKLGESLG